MITPTSRGTFKLLETKRGQRVLYLNDEIYEFVTPNRIRSSFRKYHKSDCVLSAGRFQIYFVSVENHITEHWHLELEVGANIWQGYLLPQGLPGEEFYVTRLLPTSEIISKNRKVTRKIPTSKQIINGINGGFNEKAISIIYR